MVQEYKRKTLITNTVSKTITELSPEEYKIVEIFVEFLKLWPRGIFTAEIIQHKDGRHVKYSLTESDLENLAKIPEDDSVSKRVY